MTQTHQSSWKEPWIFHFRDLMPFVVREILLISSDYDAFILEEDGPLSYRLFTDYSELSLLLSPRIIHASTVQEAMDHLNQRHFDLVIATPRLEKFDINAFGRKLKESNPELPFVLLVFDESELRSIPYGVDYRVIDQVFLWSGDSKILFAIIKHIEDIMNVTHDTHHGSVRVIVLVEDAIREYSSFLAALYSEVFIQSKALMSNAPNTVHKMLRLRSRPKILLAKKFEDAVSICEKYSSNLMGIISDIRFPYKNIEDKHAGFEFAEWAKLHAPSVPFLLQSHEQENAKAAKELGIPYLNKNAKDFIWQLRSFLKENLGFGNFVFRMPNRKIIRIAKNLTEMQSILKELPIESFHYHGSRNDFSTWLNARSMFALAALIRKISLSDFNSLEAARKSVVEIIDQAILQENKGDIVDFTSKRTVPENQFIRIGNGSIGGKGRGIAFINSIMKKEASLNGNAKLEIKIPKTIVIGTDEYDKFMSSNHIYRNLRKLDDDVEILNLFLDCNLSPQLCHDLRMAAEELTGPLAVRSSGLLEDSHFLPFAGIYRTCLLPNTHPDVNVRLSELHNAIKAVYASIFSKNARSYIANTPYRIEDEKMAVVIQQVVGRSHNIRFYPHISGVAMSYNYYPLYPQKPEDGIAILSLGLGQTVVEGGATVRFSPAAPQVLLQQLVLPSEIVQNSQNVFYALDISKPVYNFLQDIKSSLKLYTLKDAEDDGTFASVGSVYCPEDDVIRENLSLKGPRVVTFNNILKWNSIPLAVTIQKLLGVLQTAMGSAVEMEFAVDLGVKNSTQLPSFYILQVRPMPDKQLIHDKVDIDALPEEEIFCRSNRSLGHGILDSISDIVFVKLKTMTSKISKNLAEHLGECCNKLHLSNIPFILIGPGRWGSTDPNLGIPVKWSQIIGVKVIVETNFSDRDVEPSDGTHFFHNLPSLGIGYLTVSNYGSRRNKNRIIDINWLMSQKPYYETESISHYRFEKPLFTCLDGTTGNAVIMKPSWEEEPFIPPS